MSNILDKIDILDRIEIKAIQTRPGHFQVVFNCLEEGRQIVFDEKALKSLNESITERCASLGANHENTKPFIEEFVGRMIKELYRMDLCVIEDIPDTSDNPYENVKKQLRDWR